MIFRIIKEIRYYLFLASAVFLLAFLSGVYLAHGRPEEAQRMMQDLITYFGKTKDFSEGAIFFFIFFRNTLLSFLMVLLGPLFALAPLIFIFTNGEILGVIYVLVAQKEGISLLLRALLPHGILEVPAFVFSGALGFFLAEKAYRWFKFKEPFLKHFKEALFFFFKIIFPVLLIAALIETFITPLFL